MVTMYNWVYHMVSRWLVRDGGSVVDDINIQHAGYKLKVVVISDKFTLGSCFFKTNNFLYLGLPRWLTWNWLVTNRF